MRKLLPIVMLLAGAAGAQTVCRTIPVDAQDAVVAAPDHHTVLYEDADVRVLEVHSAPHTREEVHTHRRPSVMYVDSQGAGTYDTPDGRDHRSHPTDPNFKPRVIAIKPEGPHWTENTGEVPFHAIRVEFKHPGCSLGRGLPGWKAAVPGPEDAVVAAPANHTVLLENDDVRVVDVHVAAHSREPMHTHSWPGFFYVVQVAPLVYTTPAGPAGPARTMPSEVKIRPVSAEGLHSVENVGDVPFHVIRFELKYGSAPQK
jgi:quercetin dioxygenase-like cupin family protein